LERFQRALYNFHKPENIMHGMAAIECDLINVSDGERLRTIRMSVLPRAGDELDLDFGEDQQAIFNVVQVRYHVRPRKLVRMDDLIGVSIFIAAT
jgi:hypothetical protein